MRPAWLAAAFVTVAAACAENPAPPPDSIYEIVATDYAFQAPRTVPAGRVSFRLINKGKVAHELNIGVLKKGVSIDQYMKTLKSNESVRPLIAGTGGVVFAAPGQPSYGLLTVDVEEGATLAVICIFRDSAGKPRHYEMGMYSTVKTTKAVANAPVPPAATDTIIATEYAFQYPRELSPGRHTFVLKNEGKMRHEINVDLLKKGVTLAKLRAAETAGQNVDSLFDKGIGVLHAYGGQSPMGQLSFVAEPGREYLIGCYFKDNEKSPEHYSLGMFGSMQTVMTPTAAPK